MCHTSFLHRINDDDDDVTETLLKSNLCNIKRHSNTFLVI